MNRLALILLIILAVTSCSRRVVPVAVRDSVEHNIREQVEQKDVILPPDSALIHALLACDSLGRVYLKTIQNLQGERVHQSLQLDDNILTVTATDNARERHYAQHTQETLVRYKEIPVEVPVEVNRLSTWQSFQVWTGRIAIILMILFAVWRMLKARLNQII